MYPIGADATFPFEQQRDLFYLTGVDQEESVLVLFPGAVNLKHREILFVRETNAHIAVWEGPKLDKDQATAVSGIETVYWTHQFESVFADLMSEADTVYFNTNEHYRQAVETETREERFIKKVKKRYPAHTVAKSFPILNEIRGVKEPEEVDLIAHACGITEKGFRRVLGFVQPGVWEYEIEAEFLHEFVRNRSKGFAYTPIIASGHAANILHYIEAEYLHEFVRNRSKGFAYTPIIASGASANVLHYIENNKQCEAGELLLMDVAAEYANYSSDMTRTIPVSGRFSERQRKVYGAVLRVKNEATELLRPGILWAEHHKEVGKIITAELLELGLLDKADVQGQSEDRPAYKKYFMHGTCHHLGLNTHDYGELKTPIKANMVFTVEPGMYIPEEGFGVRLEDNVVVQEQGAPKNLMKSIPIEAEEIEELMNKRTT